MKHGITHSFFILLLFLAPVLVLTSCQNDEEEVNPLAAELLGKWDVNFVEVSNCEDSDLNQTLDLTSSDCFTQNGAEVCVEMTLEYREDNQHLYFFEAVTTTPSGVVTTETNSLVQTYALVDNTLSVCDGVGDVLTDCSDYEVTISGNTLTLKVLSQSNQGCEEMIRAVRQ